MAANEKTSSRVASISARGFYDPASLTLEEIRTVCASNLTQAPDRAPPRNELASALARYNAQTRPEPPNRLLALANLPPVPSSVLTGELSLVKLLAEEHAPGSLAAFSTTKSSV